jgi:hypothetical protein
MFTLSEGLMLCSSPVKASLVFGEGDHVATFNDDEILFLIPLASCKLQLEFGGQGNNFKENFLNFWGKHGV